MILSGSPSIAIDSSVNLYFIMSSAMPVRYLGTTGLRVSEICMGCMNFGDGADEFTAHEMLDQYVDAGIPFFADDHDET